MRALKAVWMGWAGVVSLLAMPRLALAQCQAAGPCILGPANPVRTSNPVQPTRPAGFTPTGINYTDCMADLDLAFSLQVTNPSSTDTLQVWAGPYSATGNTASTSTSSTASAPCVFPATRAEQCWPVVSGSVSPTATITVRAQDVVNQVPSNSYSAATSAACTLQTTPGPISLGIYFMYLAADSSVDGTAGVYQIQTDTLGPYAPADVTLTIGDRSGSLSWTPPGDPTDSVVGYYVYCQNDGDAGVSTGPCNSSVFESTFTVNVTSTDAGAAADAAVADAASDADAALVFDSGTTVPVTPAGVSQIPTSYQCAPIVSGDTASSLSNSLTLTNYDHYVFAVAAIDDLGNVGAVGNLVCGTPGPIQDFWYDYVQDGGQGGGGYCALEGVGLPAGGSCMALGVGLGVIGLVRRRRTSRS